MSDMTDIIASLEKSGFYEVLLPFLLIFTVIFAVLQKVKLFGQNSKNINIVVSLIIAFFVVRVPSIINTINMFLPKVSLLVLILLMILLVLGIFGASAEGMTGGWLFIMMAVAIVGLIWAITSSVPGIQLPSWLKLNKGDIQIIGFVVALILGIYFITKGDNNGVDWGKVQKAFGSGKLRGNNGPRGES